MKWFVPVGMLSALAVAPAAPAADLEANGMF
jgi:hypothetical protein